MRAREGWRRKNQKKQGRKKAKGDYGRLRGRNQKKEKGVKQEGVFG